MKKLIVLSAVFASLTLASCGEKKTETETTTVDSTTVATPAEAPAPSEDSTTVVKETTTEVKTDSVKH
ncbi:hypothetical protein [Flavobacterium sp.]|uniref:hypothetical protein n=1 Tax=Flavobacterium sp. TaxID=239 RepID=UPI004034A83C